MKVAMVGGPGERSVEILAMDLDAFSWRSV